MITMTVRCAGIRPQVGGGTAECPERFEGPTEFGYMLASIATRDVMAGAGWVVQDVSAGGTIRQAYCPVCAARNVRSRGAAR